MCSVNLPCIKQSTVQGRLSLRLISLGSLLGSFQESPLPQTYCAVDHRQSPLIYARSPVALCTEKEEIGHRWADLGEMGNCFRFRIFQALLSLSGVLEPMKYSQKVQANKRTLLLVLLVWLNCTRPDQLSTEKYLNPKQIMNLTQVCQWLGKTCLLWWRRSCGWFRIKREKRWKNRKKISSHGSDRKRNNVNNSTTGQRFA